MPSDKFRDWLDSRKIVFMWDDGNIVPLWVGDTHLPDDPEFLSEELGLSDALIADLVQWGRDMQAASTHAPKVTRAERSVREQSGDLLARLRGELAGRFSVIAGSGHFDEAGD